MSQNKYIGTKEAVRLTGLSTQEIYDLIHEGKLPARKAPKSGWRIFPQDLADLGLIHGEADNIVETSLQEDAYSYVADEEHYSLVFKRMTEVKQSLKIATGDLKNFIVTIESDIGEEKYSFMRLLPVTCRAWCSSSGGEYGPILLLPKHKKELPTAAGASTFRVTPQKALPHENIHF